VKNANFGCRGHLVSEPTSTYFSPDLSGDKFFAIIENGRSDFAAM
jgi:hypothetical protein